MRTERCPKCGQELYILGMDNTVYKGCDHDWSVETVPYQPQTTNTAQTKWRCKRGLETRLTYD